jgi:type III secretion system HrpE/YscL family protein
VPAVDPAAQPRTPVVPGDLYDAQRRAREVVEAAERQAEEIRRAAQEDAENARSRGHAQGYEEGLARATEVLARAYAERDALLGDAEREAVELALRAAEKIMGREVERGAAAEIVTQALTAVRRARRIRVRVSPADLEAVRAREAALVARLAPGAGFELCEDPAVPRGGCIVETEGGSIDARLETQIGALRRALLGGE